MQKIEANLVYAHKTRRANAGFAHTYRKAAKKWQNQRNGKPVHAAAKGAAISRFRLSAPHSVLTASSPRLATEFAATAGITQAQKLLRLKINVVFSGR